MRRSRQNIVILNLQKKVRINQKKIKGIASQILRYEFKDAGQLNIVFVTDKRIRALNKKYLNRDRATDVLAFDMRQGCLPKGAEAFFGDVVISAETALGNARRFGTSAEKEIVLYLIHGLLHLLGYTDSKDSRKNLLKRQAYYFERLK